MSDALYINHGITSNNLDLAVQNFTLKNDSSISKLLTKTEDLRKNIINRVNRDIELVQQGVQETPSQNDSTLG